MRTFIKKYLLLAASAMLVCNSVHAQESRQAEQADAAIDRGLAYLTKIQNKDGSFQGGGHGKTVGVPALCGMAFLAKGYIPDRAEYGETINKIIDYVLDCRRADGVLAEKNEGKYMYSHTIGTLFLSEVSGMVDSKRQARIDDSLPIAVKIILDAQTVKKAPHNQGGWRYTKASSDSDMSCTGWALMALRSARLNGAPVPREAIDDAVKYIKAHNDPNKGCFGYNNQNSYALTLTGAALLCLELAGKHGEDICYKAGDFILANLTQLPGQERRYYGNYYNAQGMFQLGGKYWEKYSEWMYTTWLPHQQADGSWNGEYGKDYGTALMVLALAVPYRQLPIYQRDETVDDTD